MELKNIRKISQNEKYQQMIKQTKRDSDKSSTSTSNHYSLGEPHDAWYILSQICSAGWDCRLYRYIRLTSFGTDDRPRKYCLSTELVSGGSDMAKTAMKTPESRRATASVRAAFFADSERPCPVVASTATRLASFWDSGPPKHCSLANLRASAGLEGPWPIFVEASSRRKSRIKVCEARECWKWALSPK